MRIEASVAAVAYLSAMTTGWNDDATNALAREFEHLENEDALMTAVTKVAQTWDKTSRPPLGILMDAYYHELRLKVEGQRQQLARRGTIRCDGHGWVEMSIGTRPCPTCSPALHRIYNEPGLLERWAHGEPQHHILGFDDREAMMKELSRMPCLPRMVELLSDDEDRACTPAAGRAIAFAAIRTESGREPSAKQRAMLKQPGS